MVRVAVYALFFLSGATALVYQVAWTRRLVLTIGSTQYAVSLVLAAWMLGLALGAGVAGRFADRVRRPLLLYAGLEAAVGVLAFAFPILLGAARELSLAAGGSRTVGFLAAFVVLLIPTTLMGATLPLLSRFVVGTLGRMGGRIGLLYGLNTFGAVAGTFLAGFVLVRELGVYGSTRAAAAANLAVAAGGVALALRLGPKAPAPATEAAGEPRVGRRLGWPVLLAAFASGLIALGSEVLWTRMLTFFLEGFTYTFAAMLTTFLLGLSLGALISGFLVDRVRDLRQYLGWLFTAAAVVSGGVLLTLTHHLEITIFAKEITNGIWENWRVHHAASLFVASFVVLFPPALVMGGIFPAVARLATRHAGEVGSRVGLVYAVNTLGSVVGALLAGLVLTRLLGMAWGAAALAFVGAAIGLALLGRRRALLGLPLAAGTVVLVLLARPGEPFIMYSHVFHGERGLERELVSYEEGIYGAVSVVEDIRNRVTTIYVDEFQAAAAGPQYRYMRMLAHLPLLLAPKWEGSEVLVICFGTGTTAGSASVHPLGRLDLVEISPEVLDQAHRFRDVNKGILDEDPDRPFPVEAHVDDGRNFLLMSDRTWDVITLEPLMPYTPGAVNFYTRDFYSLCRERLSEGGVVCQWIPIHAMSSEDYRMLVRSFVEVFPESSLWFVEETTLIIGSREALPIDYARVAARIRERKPVRDDLAAIGFADPSLVLNTFVARGPRLRRFVEDAVVMTDENPLMEFHPRSAQFPTTYSADNLSQLYGLRETRSRDVAAFLDLEGVPEAERERVLDSLARLFRGGQELLAAQHHKAASAYWNKVGDREREGYHYAEARDAFDSAVRLMPEDRVARYLRNNVWYGEELSRGLIELRRGDLTRAAKYFEKARKIERHSGSEIFKSDLVWMLLGKTRNRQGRHLEARYCLDRALERFPKSPTALAERGLAQFRLGNVRAALADLHAAFDSTVAPEVDAELLAVKKRAFQMERKGIVPKRDAAEMSAAKILDGLRSRGRGPGAESELGEILREIYRSRPERVREALATDMARARDPLASSGRQMLAIELLFDLGDLPGMLDLLATGVPEVREEAADRLGLFRRREVVTALIRAMEDPDDRVREAAWASVFILTRKKVSGFDPQGPQEDRHAAIERFREWWSKAAPHWK